MELLYILCCNKDRGNKFTNYGVNKPPNDGQKYGSIQHKGIFSPKYYYKIGKSVSYKTFVKNGNKFL